MKSLELLTALGFEDLGQDPDNRQNTRWIRQTTARHIVISLPPDLNVNEITDAIYDAGRRDQQLHVRSCHEAYARSIRSLDPLLTLPPA